MLHGPARAIVVVHVPAFSPLRGSTKFLSRRAASEVMFLAGTFWRRKPGTVGFPTSVPTGTCSEIVA